MKNRFLLLFLTIFIFFGFSFVYYFWSISPKSPNNKSTVIFVVKPGEGLNSITNRLNDEKLIKSRFGFYLKVKLMKIENEIQAGSYKLSPSKSVEELAKSLTKGTDDIWVTVIEGLRKEEIADIFSSKVGIDASIFLENSQEGIMFPDTYLIPKLYQGDQIASLMKSTFEKKYTTLSADEEPLKLTKNQIITLASLIEREANKYEDMLMIASIMKKRLQNDWALELDASVQYAMGYSKNEKSWWRKNLTRENLSFPSLYNTYLNKGLPPGPICNPGLNALKAAINASSESPYWFYITGLDGKMYYGKTLEEHNSNISKYLKKN